MVFFGCGCVFFATPFWKKLQSKNGQSCMSQKDNVATGSPAPYDAGDIPLQTGYKYYKYVIDVSSVPFLRRAINADCSGLSKGSTPLQQLFTYQVYASRSSKC